MIGKLKGIVDSISTDSANAHARQYRAPRLRANGG